MSEKTFSDRVLGLRATVAVALAAVVLGGFGGAALGAVSTGDDGGTGPGGRPGQGGQGGPAGQGGGPGGGFPGQAPPAAS